MKRLETNWPQTGRNRREPGAPRPRWRWIGELAAIALVATGCGVDSKEAAKGVARAVSAVEKAIEPPRERAPLKPSAPFVIVNRSKDNQFDSLPQAIAASSQGDIIEIRTSGPVPLPSFEIVDKDIVIMPGARANPVLTVDFSSIGRNSKPKLDLITVKNGSLTLGGLAFEINLERRDINKFTFWTLQDTRLRLVHCTIDASSHAQAEGRCLFADWNDSREPTEDVGKQPVALSVENCVFRGSGAGLAYRPYSLELSINKSLFAESFLPVGLYPHVALGDQSIRVRFDRCTVVNAPQQAVVHVPGRVVDKPQNTAVEARNSLFVRRWRDFATSPLVVVDMFTPQVDVAGKSFAWSGVSNGYVGADTLVKVGSANVFDRWEDFEKAFPNNKGSVFAEVISFLEPPPDQTVGAPLGCFRLRPNDPFAKGATDGSELGAPIPHVGAGEPFRKALATGSVALP